MEKELAKRLAEKAARGELDDRFVSHAELALPKWKAGAEGDERAPDSGVRSSFAAPPTFDDDPARPLTYSMYTVSELDDVRRSRMSMAHIAATKPPGWRDVGRSALAVLRAFGSWVRASKPRPRFMDVCRVPLVAFGADLRAVLRRLPWKTIAWATAFTAGAVALFLFAVITVAELTDDVKPKRSTSRSRIDPALIVPGANAEENADTAADEKKDEAAAEAEIEIDEEAPPAAAKPAPAAKPAAAKAGAKKKPAKKASEAELFIP